MVRMAIWTALLCGSLSLQAQGPPAGAQTPAGRGGRGGAPPSAMKNPLEGNADAIRSGHDTYGSRCASCHGADAKGSARGSDLTLLWAGGSTDQAIFQSARRGLANTLLPHSFGPDREVWTILAYLRSMGTTAPAAAGNPEAGGAIYASQCMSCHRVNGKGGRLGPDLSRVANTRSRPILAHKIRHASAYIMAVYQTGIVIDSFQPVTLVTKDGQRIRGVMKNEDAFSIQIMDSHERIQGYPRSSLREVVNDTTSLMPDFGPDKISENDLNDLLAYLGTLRTSAASRGSGQ
jgi:putative heme-binding domain-containing protein